MAESLWIDSGMLLKQELVAVVRGSLLRNFCRWHGVGALRGRWAVCDLSTGNLRDLRFRSLLV